MKKQRVLINGLGRIGRAILRINLIQDAFDLVAINDINPDNKNIAYLIKYDSTFGRLNNSIESDSDHIIIDGKPIRVYHEAAIKNVDFSGVDVVIDASGVKSNSKQIEEMEATSVNGVKKYIITNVDLKSAKNIIFGVNNDEIMGSRILSSSICDVVSLGPVYTVLEKNFGIQSGFLTEVPRERYIMDPFIFFAKLL